MEKHEKVRKSKLSYRPGTAARIKHVKEGIKESNEKFEDNYDRTFRGKK